MVVGFISIHNLTESAYERLNTALLLSFEAFLESIQKVQTIVQFFDLWLQTYKSEILNKPPNQDDYPLSGSVPSKSINKALLKIFFKSCTTTIDLIQTKLEYEKSNADNSAENEIRALGTRDDQLRQISVEH